MLRLIRPFRLLVVLLGFALVAAACSSQEDSSATQVDSSAGESTPGDDTGPTVAADEPGGADAPPTFTAERLGADGSFDSATLEGRHTVLWFWAPWCTTCRAEAPDVVEAAAQFEGTVQVIGVAGRGDTAAMEEFVEQTGTGGLDHIVDGDGSIWTGFGVAAQPAFAFIDERGEVVDVFVGTLGSDGLAERMRALAAS